MNLSHKMDEMGSLLHQLKDVMDSQEQKYDGARLATEEKLSQALSHLSEVNQKQRALEAMIHRAASEIRPKHGTDSKAILDYKAAFNEYLRAKDINAFDRVGLKDLERKALSSEVLDEGGYFITPNRAEFIATRMFESNPLRQLANVIQIGGKSIQVLVDDDEAGAEWVGEGSSRSETASPGIGLVEIVAHELSAKPKATHAMLEDSSFDVEGWLVEKIADKFSRSEKTAFITGDGVGKPRGLTTYSDWAVAGTYESGKVERVKSGSAGAFTADGLIELQNTLKEAYQPNAVFLMQRASFSAIRKLKDGNNQYLIGLGGAGLDGGLSLNASQGENGSAGAIVGAPQLTLLGKPLHFASDMPAIASGALSAAYGDFKAGYTIADRLGVTVLRDPYSDDAFVVFKSRKRVGGAVTNFDALKLQVLSS